MSSCERCERKPQLVIASVTLKLEVLSVPLIIIKRELQLLFYVHCGINQLLDLQVGLITTFVEDSYYNFVQPIVKDPLLICHHLVDVIIQRNQLLPKASSLSR